VHVFVGCGKAGADYAAFIHQKRARAAGANVDAKPHVVMVTILRERPASFAERFRI
jgi:hypothetical protein